jgi:hypothetical protein
LRPGGPHPDCDLPKWLRQWRHPLYDLAASSGGRRYVGLPDIAILGLVFSIVLDEIGRWLIRWKSNA